MIDIYYTAPGGYDSYLDNFILQGQWAVDAHLLGRAGCNFPGRLVQNYSIELLFAVVVVHSLDDSMGCAQHGKRMTANVRLLLYLVPFSDQLVEVRGLGVGYSLHCTDGRPRSRL